MMSNKQVTALVWYVAVVWAALLLVAGATLPDGFFKPVSLVTAAVVMALFIFDRWAWKWGVFRGWFVKRPYLGGTWRVELNWKWLDPSSDVRTGTASGFLVIRQTYSRLSMRLFTAESSSRLRGAEVVADADDLYEVGAVYVNEPKFSVRGKSPIHNGALILAVRGSPPTLLEGHYWTDRNTNGEIRAAERRDRTFDTYEGAEAAFGSAPRKLRTVRA